MIINNNDINKYNIKRKVRIFEGVLEDWPNRLSRILFNLSTYMEYVSPDAYFSSWSAVANLLDSFFRQYYSEVSFLSISNMLIFSTLFSFLFQFYLISDKMDDLIVLWNKSFKILTTTIFFTSTFIIGFLIDNFADANTN